MTKDEPALDAFLPSFQRIRTVFYSAEAEGRVMDASLERTLLRAVQGTGLPFLSLPRNADACSR